MFEAKTKGAMNMNCVLGLDIGGANTKACRLEMSNGHVQATGYSICYEVWKDPQGVRHMLTELKNSLSSGNDAGFDGVALTMTAELCDVFPSKAEGVLHILQMAEEAFTGIPMYVWTVQGEFRTPEKIREEPLLAAAANWLASAEALSDSTLLENGAAILADMGSTTTDIIPLRSGKVMTQGRTDTGRLLAGELLYTGVLRTAVQAIIDEAFIDGLRCRLANEYFAVSADVYRLLGMMTEQEYDVPTPDGGGQDFDACARRLARIVASEPEEIGMKNIFNMAQQIREKHIGQVFDGISRIVSRKELAHLDYIVTTGQGSFILEEAARRLNIKAVPWWQMLPGGTPDLVMSAYAVAYLLHTRIEYAQ